MGKTDTDRWQEPGPSAALPSTDFGKDVARVLRCKVYLVPEEDGGFSVIAADLPGAASQGDSEEEALRNICDALEGVMASYKDCGEEIPWAATSKALPDPAAKTLWVEVHG